MRVGRVAPEYRREISREKLVGGESKSESTNSIA
jgi:hypothetical protein